MLNTLNKEEMILTAIVNQSWLKYCFGYSFTIASASRLEQELTNGNFFTNILESIPSQVVVVLGIIYGVALVGKQISNTWFSHQNNRLNYKQNKENLEQKEIETDLKRKELKE